MAAAKNGSRKSRTTVPVVSRTKSQNNSPAKSTGKKRSSTAKPKRDRLDLAGYAVLAVVTIGFLISVSVPLNNFYDGRSEIARLEESIAAKKAKKEQLLSSIEKYRSDSYIEQEARRRLGVVEPGETAYRILDPKMRPHAGVTTDKKAQQDSREWFTVLWDSVAEPVEES